MTIRNRLRLSHDRATGRITLYLRGGTNRRNRTPLSWVDRADLRELCDMLHDYADRLDREDREPQPEPARPNRRRRGRRGRGVKIASTDPTEASAGRLPSLPHEKEHASAGGRER